MTRRVTPLALALSLLLAATAWADPGPWHFRFEGERRDGKGSLQGTVELSPGAEGRWSVTIVLDSGDTYRGTGSGTSDGTGGLELRVEGLSHEGPVERPLASADSNGVIGALPFGNAGEALASAGEAGTAAGGDGEVDPNAFLPDALRLRRLGPGLQLKFYDAERQQIGRGDGQADWERETQRLHAALDQAGPEEREQLQRQAAATRMARDEADRLALMSRDPEQTQDAVERLQDRIARLHEHLRGQPEGDVQHYLDDLRSSQAALNAALRARDDADRRQIESGDPEQTQAAVDRLQDRITALREHLNQSEPGDEVQGYIEDLRNSEAALGAARRARDDLDRRAIESGSAPQTQAAVDRLQDRIADLREHLNQTEPGDETQVYIDELRNAEAALGAARRARDDIDRRDIESKDPYTTQAAVERLEDRVTRLREELSARSERAGPNDDMQVYIDELRNSETVLDAARRARDEADIRDIEAKDPFANQAAVERLQARARRLRARLSGTQPDDEVQVYVDSLRHTETALAAARRARDEGDRRQIESGDAFEVQDVISRLSDRRTQLRQLMESAPPDADISDVLDDLRTTDAALAEARRALSELEGR